jgi:hypothetical protein
MMDEELLHTGPGFRLLTGRDSSGDVYYAREYELPEDTEHALLADRLERLPTLHLPGLARITEARLDDSGVRIAQEEVTGANLTTLLKWDPKSVTPDRFRKWAFEFCLFLRALYQETDWSPSPVHLDQLMVTPDDRLMALSGGWEGLFESAPADREGTYLKRFREFTTPLLEHMEQQGHEVTSLCWVTQHRASSLDELRESLDRGAPFVPSSVDELKPLASFDVPDVEEPQGLLSSFFSQSPWRLFVQFGVLVVSLVLLYHYTRPTPLPTQGVYVLTGKKVCLLDSASGGLLGKLPLPARGRAVGLIEDPPRIAVALHKRRKVVILDRIAGGVVDSFLAEGPVTQIVRSGSLLCMNQGDLPGVLLYDSKLQKPTNILLTASGVTSMAVTDQTLIAACRDRHRLYAFALPHGELLSQREMRQAKVLGAESGKCYISFDAGTKLGVVEATTLKTLKQIPKEAEWDLAQILSQSNQDVLWALSPSAGCTLLRRETLEPLEQFQFPGKAGQARLLRLKQEGELWVCLPERGSIMTIAGGQNPTLQRETKLRGKPSAVAITTQSEE